MAWGERSPREGRDPELLDHCKQEREVLKSRWLPSVVMPCDLEKAGHHSEPLRFLPK